ncbi:MAG: universal stress protein [Gemmataceae bacterium]
MLPVRSILVPTDFSPTSDLAFRLACSVARDTGARITVLHVLTPPMVVFGEGIIPPVPPDYPREWQDKLEAIQPPRHVPIEHRLIEGDPANTILDVAKEIDCDLIVLGTHGRTGLNRVFMGSVAEKVIRKANCPVLTIKAPLKETSMEKAEELATAGV